MPLTRHDIEALIPHAGPMCVLDEITRWDEASIRARSGTHRKPDNPLRVGGVLSTWCGIEYAAQAMAVHGALTGAVSRRPRRGYLVSVRNTSCFVPRLDECPGDLFVEATLTMAEAERVAYTFVLEVGGREVLNGGATVILDVRDPAP